MFGLAPVAFEEWSVLLLFPPPTVLLLDEGRKLLVRRVSRPPAP
jgi:hypothetical protein